MDPLDVAPVSYTNPLVLFGLIFLGAICIVIALVIIFHRRNH
jgi:hypothetical protein